MSTHRLPRRGDWRRGGRLTWKRLCPLVEWLEDRPLFDAALFSAVDPAATPSASVSASVSPGQDGSGLNHPDYLLLGADGPGASPLATAGPTGTTPTQIEHAYGFDQISFSGGTVAGDGTGTTIAIVDAYNDPNISNDLHQFDLQFGIPDPPVFTQVNQSGGSKLPAANSGWISEIALDVEWSHAIAPKANILLVEANNSSDANLDAAVAYAAKQPGVVVVSMSWGGSEYSGELSADSTFLTPTGHAGVTFVSSAGDDGAPPEEPATSPNVLAVGGTTLDLDSSGDILSESAWSGSGGGISAYESQPSYQSGVVTQSQSARTNPDVSYDADPSTGFPVYDSYNNPASAPWSQFGGTSDAAPQWAALIAIADQGRALAGLGSLDGRTQTLPSLYTLPSSDFHDITAGGSTGTPAYSAASGYDLVTGRGTPVANKIVAGLIPIVTGSLPAVGSTVSTPPASYSISFSLPVNPASLQASAFTVDGIAASSVSLNAAGTTATFTFNADPVTSQGVQTMQLAAGAISVAGAPGMTIAGFTGTFTANTQPLSTPMIVWPTPADIAYGTPLGSTQLDATASFAGSSVMGVFIYMPAAGILLNAGANQTLAVSFTPADPTSYSTATATVSINVDPAPLVVAVANASKVYGAANPAFGVGYQGFVLGQTASVLGGNLTYSTTATAVSSVGGYTVSASGLTSSNYAISFVNGTLNVTPAPLMVAADNLSRLYGAANPTLTGTLTGLQNNDPITAVYTTSATPASDAGTVPITATLNDAASKLGNYTVTISTGTLTITPAPLLVTVATASKVYGAADPAFGVGYQGFVLGQTASAMGGNLTYSTTATAASSVGGYTVSASGLTSSNYAISFVNGALNVTPAPLMVAADNLSRLYGAANPTLTGTLTGLENNDPITAVYTTSATPASDAGTVPITATLSDPASKLGNYTVTISTGTLTITAALLIVTPNSFARLYGAANPTLTGTLSGVVNGDTITASFITLANASSAAGPYSVTAALSGAKLSDYTVTANTGTLTITPVTLVVTVGSSSKVYGAADPAFGASLQGFVLGQTASALAGSLTYSTPATAASGVGNYPVSAGGLTSSNYLISFVNGTLNVTPASLVVAPDNLSRLYGAANPTLTGTITGLENNDPITFTYATSAGSASDVGAYPIDADPIDPMNRLGNYKVTISAGSLTITAAPLIVTPNSSTRLYGAANPAFGVGYQGFVLSQTASVLGGSPTFSTSATAASGIGAYTVSASGLTSSNYAISFVNGTLNVTPAPLVVTPDNLSRVYGAANPILTGTLTGLENNDPIIAVYTTSATPASDAGTVSITATLSDPASKLGNYTVTFNGGNLTITPAPLLVTVATASKVYGAADPAFGVGYQGFVLGQAASTLGGSVTFSTTATAASGIGGYTVSASGLTSTNYAISFVNGTLNVTPALLAVTPDNVSQVYGAASPTLTGTITGLENNDPITVTYTTSTDSTGDVGTYPINAALSDPSNRLSNYTVTIGTAALTITPAPLVVTPNSFARLYGAANPTLTGTLSGVVNGDAITASFSTLANASSAAGPYSITAALSGAKLFDYTVTASTGTLTVNVVPLVVTVSAASKVYGQPNPAFGVSYQGFVLGQTATALGGSLTYSTAATAASGVGGYTVSAGGLTSSNYAISFVNGTLNVTPAPLVATPDDVSRLYGAANPPMTGTLSGVQNGDAITATFSTLADASSPAGSYDIDAALTGANLPDYDVTSNTGTLTVTPAPLVVTVASSSKVYGTANPAFAVTYQGYVLGQDPSVLGGTLTYSTAATAASGIGASTVSASGLTSSNYVISFVNGTLNVTPAPLVVTPDDLSRLYGAANPALTGTITGLRNNDPITATYATSAVATSDVGLYDITATLAGANLQDYDVSTASGTLTIEPAPLVVTIADSSKVYGAANPSFGVTFQGFALGQDASVLAGTPTYATIADGSSPVGTYPVTAGGLTAANYALSFAGGTLTVTPAPLTVTPSKVSRVYGAANPSITGTITGLQNDDPITASYTTSASAASDVGAYPVVATLNDPAKTLGNYTVTSNTGTLTVTPAPLVVTPDSLVKTYGDTAVLTGQVVGQQQADTFTVTYASDGSAAAANVGGSYPITVADVSGARIADYTVIVNTATLTVNPAPLTVTADDASKVAGETNPTFTAQYAGFVLGQGPNVLTGALSFQTPAAVSSPAGQYTITPDGLQATNYTIAYAAGNLQVTPAPSPLVTVMSVHLQTEKVSRKKTVKVLVVDYSGALEPGPAQAAGNYQLVVEKNKKLGARDQKPLAIASATYNPGAQSVTLTPAGKLPSGPLHLTITASGVLDVNGRALDGNNDGQPGGNFQLILAG